MSFYDSASLAFLPSGGAGKDGKAYSIKPVPEYGNELVTNGGFDTDSDWVKVSSTISGGTGNLNGTGVTSLLYQSNVLTQNKKYYLTFTISNYNGLGQLEVINNDGTVYYLATSNGNISIEFTHSIANQNFLFRARNSAIASIDNVSVKEVIVDGDFTFSRGSNLTATRVDSNGLIEKGRENLLLQSNQFDTTWSSSNFTLTPNQSGYDGSSDAWKAAVSVSYAGLIQNVNGSGVYTFSGYFRKGDSNEGIRFNFDASTDTNVYVNLTDGSSTFNGGLIERSITDAGNGFYKVVVTANLTNLTGVRIFVTNGTTTQVAGNIYIQDFQLEQGLVATEYIESGATTGLGGLLEDSPRFDYSGGASCPSLLLEPSRTNVWEYSEYLDYSFASVSSVTITQNTTETLSPEGLYNATKLEGVGSWSLRDFIAGTDTGTWTISCYIKAVNASSNNTFRLSVGGNNYSSNLTATSEWQRFDLTITNGGATAAGILRDTSTNDADLYIYGFQVEEGSYSSSYIPNHSGGSVTRDAETNTTANISSVIGQQEGTFFLDFEYLNGQAGENENWIALESENGQERVMIYKSGADNYFRAFLTANNSLVFNNPFSSIVITPNTRYKIAFRYSSGDIAVAINGNLEFTNSSTYTRGSDLSRVTFNESNIQPSCRVHQAIAFNTALSTTDCEILTGATSYESFSAMATALNYTTYE